MPAPFATVPASRGLGKTGGSALDPETTAEIGIKPGNAKLAVETFPAPKPLHESLAKDFDTALVSVLHALCLAAFYRYGTCTCLEITAKSAGFGIQAPGLNDSSLAKSINERHEHWAKRLPEETAALWDALLALGGDDRAALFAHCASVSVNAVHEAWNRSPGRAAHANQLAQSVSLDMVAAGWAPTVENYLGRVTKARILEAVREAKGEASVQLIDHLKKPDMAKEAERLLAGCGWLPEPLRMPDAETETQAETAPSNDDGEALPAFLAEDAAGPSESGDTAPPEPLSAIAVE